MLNGKCQLNIMIMKMSCIFHVFIIWLVTPNLLINIRALAASEEYEAELEQYAKLTEVVSGGFNSGSRVFIRVGDYTFYDNAPDGPPKPAKAGLYVVAIFKNRVLLKHQYNTYSMPRACENLQRTFGTFHKVHLW